MAKFPAALVLAARVEARAVSDTDTFTHSLYLAVQFTLGPIRQPRRPPEWPCVSDLPLLSHLPRPSPVARLLSLSLVYHPPSHHSIKMMAHSYKLLALASLFLASPTLAGNTAPYFYGTETPDPDHGTVVVPPPPSASTTVSSIPEIVSTTTISIPTTVTVTVTLAASCTSTVAAQSESSPCDTSFVTSTHSQSTTTLSGTTVITLHTTLSATATASVNHTVPTPSPFLPPTLSSVVLNSTSAVLGSNGTCVGTGCPVTPTQDSATEPPCETGTTAAVDPTGISSSTLTLTAPATLSTGVSTSGAGAVHPSSSSTVSVSGTWGLASSFDARMLTGALAAVALVMATMA
ncbi:hypothetical protein F4780DRAFT_562876 [Xylariomycetidae sp. FL0641]|nr:hypothetical protein F4780DRAFT_562876 [Xylariomycetidae sp. FL0641]